MKKKQSLSAHVLVVDHEQGIFDSLLRIASANGIHLTHARSMQECFDKNSSSFFDVVLMKDRLPDGSAADAAENVYGLPGTPELIVYSQKGDPNEAENILKSGAWDYVVTPASPKKLLNLLKQVIRYRQEKHARDESNHSAICAELQHEGIVGSSPALQSCLNLVAKAALSESNVLVTGESGTGKELFASSIHKISPRANKNFVVVDCTALPTELVESILFGHEKGAFTGADKSKPGLIKQADGGTLFLDEIGELPLAIQKKFLRVLQERAFRPVGGHGLIKCDFRLIAATNKDLDKLTRQGKFREDLLFRLKTFHLELPPLRVRRGDITELAYFFRSRCRGRIRDKEKSFSPDFLMVLKQYDWPGNVRELFHALERSIAAAGSGKRLYPQHLPTEIRVQVTRQVLRLNQSRKEIPRDDSFAYFPDEKVLPPIKDVRQRAVEAEERKYLKRLMEATRGDIRQSCRISGLSRSRLYDLLKKYRLIGQTP